nr:transcription factor DREB1 [Ipomoea batatas]
MDCQAEETDISKQAHRRSPCSKPPGKPIKSTSTVVDEEQAAGMSLTTKETHSGESKLVPSLGSSTISLSSSDVAGSISEEDEEDGDGEDTGAATSCALAAISGLGKVPSQMRDFFRGSRISETHFPQFLIRTPRYTGCLLPLSRLLFIFFGPFPADPESRTGRVDPKITSELELQSGGSELIYLHCD